MPGSLSIGNYLIRRLEELGLRHVFGIPGDYVLRFYDLLVESKIEIVGTCGEAGAGFAADAYARVNGLGCVCVTYCVGGLNVVNAVAGAYAEKSPLILISGAPGMGEREIQPYLHHRVREFNTQFEIFSKVTVAAEALEDPAQAPRQIDRALAACLSHKRPIYLELPRDRVDEPCQPGSAPQALPSRSNPKVLAEAAAEAAAMLRAARKPVILCGVEIHRFGLQKLFLDFVNRSGFPVAGTLLGKSVISELHPQYLGIYEGNMGHESVRRAVEDTDCLIILGAFMTDFDIGMRTTPLDPLHMIDASAERISIKHHHYEKLVLRDFIKKLTRLLPARPRKFHLPRRAMPGPFRPQPHRAVTVRRFFARLNELLSEETIVVADIGDCLFGAADLTIHRGTEFLSPAYYTSMGFAVPAALGAQVGRRKLRPIVIVGDGAFQMTGHEVSSIAAQGLNPIIFVLNNKGYTTERYIHEGPYNDIHNWAYHKMADVLCAGLGLEVHTEGELELAIAAAWKNRDSFTIVNIHLDPLDCSASLERLGKRFGAQVSMTRAAK